MAKLVSVVVGLEGTLNRKAEVLALLGAQGGELNVAVSKVKTGDLLIEDLGQHVDTNIELAGLGESDVLLAESLVLSLEEHDLGKDLVGKRAGHDEGGVAGCAAQVDETTLGKEDDMAAAGHQEAVDLGLDVLNAGGVLLQPSNVNLAVKVTNVWGAKVSMDGTRGIPFERDDILQTMASLGMAEKCSPTMMSVQPVVVTKI